MTVMTHPQLFQTSDSVGGLLVATDSLLATQPDISGLISDAVWKAAHAAVHSGSTIRATAGDGLVLAVPPWKTKGLLCGSTHFLWCAPAIVQVAALFCIFSGCQFARCEIMAQMAA